MLFIQEILSVGIRIHCHGIIKYKQQATHLAFLVAWQIWPSLDHLLQGLISDYDWTQI